MPDHVLGAWRWPLGSSAPEAIDTAGWTGAAKDLAARFRPGQFTTMRLDNRAHRLAPVALDLHCGRLSGSADSTAVRNSIISFLQQLPVYTADWLAAVLIVAPAADRDGLWLGCCLKELAARPETCAVLAKDRAGRSDPMVKSTRWIQERQQLEDLKGTEYEEVLLVEDGAVLEGLSSNFAAISQQGCLVTAPPGRVLAGSVMGLVRQACAELGIPVAERCPAIGEAASWQAAFITSTSRLVLPVARLDHRQHTVRLDSPASAVLQSIIRHVNAQISP